MSIDPHFEYDPALAAFRRQSESQIIRSNAGSDPLFESFICQNANAIRVDPVLTVVTHH